MTVDPERPAAARPLLRAIIVERQALIDFVERYMPPPLRGLEDPADVVQDVCFEALRREDNFDPVLDPTGRRWLFTLARRRLTRLWERRMASRQVDVQPGDDDSLGQLLTELAVYERTPSASAASHETWAAVDRAFGKLSPDHAAVLRSRFYDREPLVDFAARTNRTADAIHKLAQRAMAALRVELRGLIANG